MSIAALTTPNVFDLFARSLTLEEALIVDTVKVVSVEVGAATINSQTQGPIERSPVPVEYCWTDLLSIPSAPPAPAAWPGGAQSGPVIGISGVPLGRNPGDPLEFGYQWSSGAVAPLDKFSSMVPAGTSNYAYTPTLSDSLSATIPYDPLVWVADGLRQVIVFLEHPPEYYGFTPPLSITYWRYVGGTALVGGTNLLADGPTVGNVFADATDNLLSFRSLLAGAGVSLSQTADSITISSSGGGGGLSGLSNEGGGAAVYDTVSGSTAVLRTLVGTTNGLAVDQTGTTITIDNTLRGQNVGTGTGNIYNTKSGATLNFNSLAGGSGITVSAAVAGTITIANTGVVALGNEGGAAEIFDTATSGTLRTLLGTANGLSVVQNATTITIDNTLSGQNLGSGSGAVFSDKTGAALRFNSLAGGSGISVTPAVAGTITIANTGVVALSNEGGQAQVYDTTTSGALRTLIGTSNGLTVTQNPTTITFDNTLSGSNIGSGTGNLFSGKVGAMLQFNSLLGGTGITVSAASGGTVTITNTAPDQPVTITAGAGITVTGGYPNFTISATSAAPMALPVDTQFFSAAGTYNKAAAVAAGATKVTIIIAGGGGGGGSGSVGSTSASINGGGGGNAGAISIVTNVPISLLGSAEAFVSGAGGLGASGVTATPGNAGSSGGRSTFFMYGADGGAGGVGGTNPSGGGAVVSSIKGNQSLFYNAGSWDPTYQVAAITENTGAPYNGGGGGGSSVDSNVVKFGGTGCSSPTVEGAYLSATPGFTLGAAGNGANATTAFYTYYGVGGAGGSGNGAFKGGNGLQGGGGGGGSATTSGTSGGGGAGGNGWLLVYAFA